MQALRNGNLLIKLILVISISSFWLFLCFPFRHRNKDLVLQKQVKDIFGTRPRGGCPLCLFAQQKSTGKIVASSVDLRPQKEMFLPW
jgi:hypothetical protein